MSEQLAITPPITLNVMDVIYPTLILPCHTGLTFEFQTGGLACNHPQIEGMILPLPVGEESWRENVLTK